LSAGLAAFSFYLSSKDSVLDFFLSAAAAFFYLAQSFNKLLYSIVCFCVDFHKFFLAALTSFLLRLLSGVLIL